MVLVNNRYYPHLALPQIFHIRNDLEHIKNVFYEEIDRKGLNGEYIFEGRIYIRQGSLIIPVSTSCVVF